MKRIKLKKHRNNKIYNKIILIIIVGILSLIFLFVWLNKIATPILMNYAKLETKKLSTIIINRAISKNVASNIDINELINTTLNSNNEIQAVDFNPYMVNKLLSLVTNSITINLKYLESGQIDLIELPEETISNYDKEKLKKGIIYLIPIGVITKNSFLSNLGPKIPVRLNLIGSVEANISTNIKEYGINNAVLEVIVDVSVAESVNLPFATEPITVETKIPIAMKVIQGKIPEYYSNGINKDSNMLKFPIK